MKAKISLFLFTMLLVSGMAFAAGGYYNLVSIQTGISYPMFGGFGAADSTLVLTQDVNTCRDASWAVYFNNSYHSADGTGKIGRYSGFGWQQAFSATGRCVASAESTPENLYKMLKTHWVDAMVAKNLSLGNDIDLGETSSTAGKCVANHVPLPFRENTVFDGQWKKISNMCYVGSTMDKPVGFFESVSNSVVQRIDFNHARVVVKGGSNDGADYYPVGAVAGAAILSTIDSISIANDSLEAPLAGGVVGASINTTLQNISGDEDIFITNAQLITTGYAGSEYIETAASTDAQKISLATPYSVFLGGLAGVVIRSNEDPSLTGVSVKVDVHDSVSANRSALGGAVGLLFASTETISNVNVLVKKKMNESIPSRISGGSAMGGLVGYVSVFYENNSPVLGRVTIENSSFAGEIKNAASDAIIAVGGLVGRDSSLARMGFSIKNSSAEVTVDDNLETAGAYHYYAGGILGYSNDCISSVVEDDFVSITGSKASGSIAIAAEGDLHVQTFVGGIAGAGCFAMGEVGIKNDTSAVEISTNIKTGNDEQFDSVTVGGILGALNVAGNQGATLSNLLYTGNISVEDGLGYVFAGGVIGRFRGAEGGKSISFNDIMVKSAGKLIDYNATAASKPAGTNVKSTLIGGLCGKCHEIETIERVGVNGGISVAGKYAGDSLFVGGLVARFHNTNHNLKLEANFTIGDISVGSVTAGVNKVGYLLGFGLLKADGYSIRSNYHYGENDLDVNPFGVISETDLSDDGFTASWKTNDLILFNIRNGENKAYTNKHHDGTEIGENMKKSSFAGFLNGAFDKEQGETYAWTFVAGKNNDLPLFADGKNDAVEPDATTLVVTFLDKDGETIVQKNVEDGASLEFPTEEEVPEFAGWHFVGWEEVDVVTVHSDLSVNAIYEINTYEVKFFGKDQKTQIGETQVVNYEGAAVAPEAPTLVGYNFKGWDSYAFESVTSVLNINAVYEAIEYEVTFANYDGSVLSSSMVAYDTWAPEPVNVSREATAAYEYTFVGWDPEVTAVAGEVTYTAVYDSVKVKYDVAFYDFDGKQIGETQSVEYGAAAEEPEAPVSAGRVFKGWSDKTFKEVVKSLEITALYDSASFNVTLLDYKGDTLTALTDVLYNKDLSGQASPAREATKEYAYTFKGWSPELGKVVSDTTVKAVYDSVKVKYDVAFYDFDGKQIGETQSVEYGAAAEEPEAPVSAGRVFKGWSDKTFKEVVKSLEITALYDSASFNVTLLDYKGDTLTALTDVLYNKDLSGQASPAREATKEYAYTFKGWSPELGKVVSDTTVKAVYDSVKVKYDVAFYDFDGKQIGETQSVEYGAAAEEPEAPVSAGRVFKGWSDKTFKEVVKSLEITALYDSASFNVTLLDYKGDTLTALTDVLYNKDLSGQASPAREATKEYAYTFKGWSPELGKVVSDTTVKAVYDSVKVKYDVAFYDFDGKQIGETQSVEYGAAAVLPAVPEREGFDFVCWSDSARVVTNSLEIRPIYVPAVVSSSSSEPESSSSSEEIESSSSSYLFAEKMIEDSSMVLTGDAFFVGYKVSVVDPALATSVRLVVTGDNGYSMDKILVDSLETSTYSDSLSLLRLPAGNYTAELVVANDSAADSFTYSFFVQPEITVMARSWQMISMAGVDMNKMDLGRDASFYWWNEQNPIGDYWQYRAYEGEELEATRGYWYGTSEGRSIVLREVTGKVDSSIVWDLDSLFSGWNLVANPYNWYVDLSKGKSDNGDSVQFWRWNPETSEYDIPKVLGPYEAIWVKVNRATRWSMPSAPLFDLEKISSDKKFSSMEKVASLRKGAARKASASSWTLLATLSDNYGKTDSWNVLGAGLQPETMEKAPLGMGEYVRMTIADGKKKLAKSVKNVADEYEWTLNVGANSSRDGKIAFAGVSELNKLGYRLLVTSDGKTAELGEGETFPVALAKISKKVNIRVVKTGAVASSRQIRGLSMAQASGKLLMQVDVSTALAGAASRYVLVDAKGKTVANGRFTALAGSNSVALKAPVSGQYFMQVQVGSQTLTRRFSVK
ncbi:MAG: InlB B-repeat-containing protein [Fibrobacter sp.]|nr:InlB B-repeat-containing protein [Fibrobacter sp.]